VADLLRHVEGQIVRIDTPRLEAKAGPKDRAQIGVAAPRIRGEPDHIVGPGDGALFHHHGATRLFRKTRCAQDVTQHWANIPFEPDLRSGDEIAYLRSGDQLGCVIEDDPLDFVADVSPVKDVGNVGQRYHNEATDMS
jgi:hypothetical protein